MNLDTIYHNVAAKVGTGSRKKEAESSYIVIHRGWASFAQNSSSERGAEQLSATHETLTFTVQLGIVVSTTISFITGFVSTAAGTVTSASSPSQPLIYMRGTQLTCYHAE